LRATLVTGRDSSPVTTLEYARFVTDEKEGAPRTSGVASRLAEGAGNVLSAALRPVGEATSGARRMIGERSGARVRQVRRMGQEPLRNLWEVHPSARHASIHDRGLCTVPVEQICGTAVEGPIQRGGDFLPVRDRRGQDWRARWQRIRSAVDSLTVLPPIDLYKVGDCYWVIDGHNRVAAALYTGQIAVDANVLELQLPGQARIGGGAVAAYVLESSQDLRAAGSGRLTRTSVRPTTVLPEQAHADHAGHTPQAPAAGAIDTAAEASDDAVDTDAGRG
jgi:hypothetical protein